MQAVTRYAKSGDVHIAYRVFGTGPRDLVLVPGTVSHVELYWELPASAYLLQRLARFARVIVFDKRGQGLSDRVADMSLDERVGDLRAVLDATGCHVKLPGVTVADFRDGKIRSYRTYFDDVSLIEQIVGV